MENAIIDLKNILFTNDGYIVLENVNLSIYKNSFTTIIGKSGSGKTSLLKLLSAIYYPDRGNVSFFSKDFNDMNEIEINNLRKKTGFVFQDSALISNLTIKENLMLPVDFHNRFMKEKDKVFLVHSLLEKVGLTESLNERPAQLSMGEQKLISFIRGIILKPEILFLDEPLAYLDETNMKRVLILIKEYYQENNATIIAVTNLKSLIFELAKRIVLIDNKKIYLDEDLDNLKKENPDELPELLKDILM